MRHAPGFADYARATDTPRHTPHGLWREEVRSYPNEHPIDRARRLRQARWFCACGHPVVGKKEVQPA